MFISFLLPVLLMVFIIIVKAVKNKNLNPEDFENLLDVSVKIAKINQQSNSWEQFKGNMIDSIRNGDFEGNEQAVFTQIDKMVEDPDNEVNEFYKKTFQVAFELYKKGK